MFQFDTASLPNAARRKYKYKKMHSQRVSVVHSFKSATSPLFRYNHSIERLPCAHRQCTDFFPIPDLDGRKFRFFQHSLDQHLRFFLPLFDDISCTIRSTGKGELHGFESVEIARMGFVDSAREERIEERTGRFVRAEDEIFDLRAEITRKGNDERI